MLGASAYGHIRQHGGAIGSVVVYSCIRGYKLHGSSSRVCNNEGKWSGMTPTCEVGMENKYTTIISIV